MILYYGLETKNLEIIYCVLKRNLKIVSSSVSVNFKLSLCLL